MEQETELNIHKKKKKALLCSMDVDNCLDFSHKSTRLSTMEIYEADATRNINSFLTAVSEVFYLRIFIKKLIMGVA